MANLVSSEKQISRQCVSCATLLAGKFCHVCGEKAFDPHDHSIRHFLNELVHTITHLDGKFFISLKHLFFKPGALTREYLAGRKKLFTKPLALFVIANVIYFFAQPLANINSFNSTLANQTAPRGLGNWAKAKVEDRVQRLRLTREEYELRYNAKSEQLAKSLVIAQIPLLAALVNALYFLRRRFFFDHLVFATHFYTFMLWLNILITGGVFLYLKWGGNSYNLEVPLFVITGVYFMFATRTVYRSHWMLAVLNGVLLTGGFALTLIVYRVILFLAAFLSV